MKIGKREFKLGSHTYIWGILNLTPDSFSDGGKYNGDGAVYHVEEMIRDGADIIDIGGQSTRPGYVEVPEEEEIKRVVPVIKKIRKSFDIPISIDTFSAAVAHAAIEEGADLVNDIWGLKRDAALAGLLREKGVPVCLMHNRGNQDYGDFLSDLKNDLMESVSIALSNGIKKENIILDPGIGFAKSYEQNLIILNNLSFFKELGYPLLLGASRKSFIGKALKSLSRNENGAGHMEMPVNEREEGTLVTTVLAVQAGCDFVRVHDVKKNKRAVCMMEAVKGKV